MRTLLALLCAAALSAAAHADSFSVAAFTLTGTAPTTCPMGTSYADGCAGAQATGSLQHTNFFNGYTVNSYPAVGSCSVADPGSGGALRCRPPWNVAAVDYAIGYAGTLTDAAHAVQGTNIIPAGCATYSASNGSNSNQLNINSHPCMVTHLDFTGTGTSHGCIALSDLTGATGTLTIDNDNFAWLPDTFTKQASSCQETSGLITVTGANASVVIQYSQITGTSDTAQTLEANTSLHCCGNGSVTVKYTACLLDVQHCYITGAGNLLMEYDYGERFGFNGAHGNWVYLTNSTPMTFLDQFNTKHSLAGDTAGSLTEMASDSGNWSSTAQNDTEIGSAGTASLFAIQGKVADSAINEIITNNYYDPTNVLEWLYATSASIGSVSNKQCSGNINLLTGVKLTGVQGAGPAALTCN